MFWIFWGSLGDFGNIRLQISAGNRMKPNKYDNIHRKTPCALEWLSVPVGIAVFNKMKFNSRQ
jgi:hypothetical protein